MKLLLFAVLIAALCAFSAPQKPPDVQIIDLKARRGEETIVVDARARNAGTKPLRGLILFLDFLSTSRTPLTSLRIAADEESLAPGEEAAFHTQTDPPPGAVRCAVRAFSSGDRELRVANAGPFPIE